MGYAGGSTPNPTYRNIGDHAEAVRLHFDPTEIRFADLLEMFWAGHDPLFTKASQYRASLFCADEAQFAEAGRSADAIGASLGEPVTTPIVLDTRFYSAEGYHQKWRLRQQQAIFSAMLENYPSEAALIASTAAAKANGYLGGRASPAALARDVDRLGLPPAQRDALRMAAMR